MDALDAAVQIKSPKNRSVFKFSLFRSPSFVLVCTSSFCQLLGSFVPYVYLTGIFENKVIRRIAERVLRCCFLVYFPVDLRLR